MQPFSAFAAAPMLDWLLKEKQITQHVSVLDRSNREGGTCERADCPSQHAGTTDVCDWQILLQKVVGDPAEQ